MGYADRLIRLVVEFALGVLPFSEKMVTAPSGELYLGASFSRRLCGVSFVRSGEAMENALRACCAGIRIGKMLVQGGEPGTLVYEKLPHDIAERQVLLMDPILGTGFGVATAIQSLMTHSKVDEKKIVLLTLIAAPEGIKRICSAYPEVKIITSEIDETVGPDNNVMPGIGDFGDRYFGTGRSTCDRRAVGEGIGDGASEGRGDSPLR